VKPIKIKYLLAHGFALSTWGGSVLLTDWVVSICYPAIDLIGKGRLSRWYLLSVLVGVLVAIPLGWILGGVILWPLVSSVGRTVNGAPYAKGDQVRILIGAHRDRLVRVYEVWPSRHQVRVELDEQAKMTVKDVFMYNEVCREKGT
jgi:hypothetical protein